MCFFHFTNLILVRKNYSISEKILINISIAKFGNKPPQSPVVALMKLKPKAFIVEQKVLVQDLKGPHEYIHQIWMDKQFFEGKSFNKKSAKFIAFKNAVQFYNINKTITFFKGNIIFYL